MNIAFSAIGWEDYTYWQQSNKKVLKRNHMRAQQATEKEA